MFLRKLSIVLLFFINSSSFADFGIISDPDGFTNIRREADGNSHILYTLASNDVIFCFDDIVNGYYSVETQKTAYKNGDFEENFIHKSRVKMLSEYPKLSARLIENGTHKLFTGYGYSIEIKTKIFNVSQHKISYANGDNQISLLDGHKKIWGTDQITPLSEYEYLKISLNNRDIIIPRKYFGDLFNPDLKRTNVYYDSTTKIVYIAGANGDGAGSYSFVMVIKSGKLIKRFVVLSEYA
jgi:hypothetical protein